MKGMKLNQLIKQYLIIVFNELIDVFDIYKFVCFSHIVFLCHLKLIKIMIQNGLLVVE